MKVVARTNEYTIYQKRSNRYAVKAKDRSWINGDAKAAILLERNLIQATAPKPVPVEEPAAEEPAAEAPAAEADATAGGDAPAEG